MSNILDQIFASKKNELPETKKKCPLPEIKQKIADQKPVLGFYKALEKINTSKVIAEIKPKTPFKGELRKGFNVIDIAREYVEHGAATLSVLTENNYFGGSVENLAEIRKIATIPLLRKDFIFDEYQVYESRAFGADLFLLIATWLANRPDASIDQIDNSHVGHDPLRSQIAQVLDTRKKAAAASSGIAILTSSTAPLSPSNASSPHHEQDFKDGLWPAKVESPQIAMSESLDRTTIDAAHPTAVDNITSNVPAPYDNGME